ncbi:LytR C-terminal domain-containing protein [Catellatospora citrea]|uniref:LytR C-terminal domain-containing protein n=1 Tax=Catellatospora citrea TaxID=53366 RepID=UPI0033F414EF
MTTTAAPETVEPRPARRRIRLAVLAVVAGAVVALVTTVLTVTAPDPTSPSALPAGCRPGQTPVSLDIPTEKQAQVNVFNGTATADLAGTVAAGLRDRGLSVGTVGNEQTRQPGKVAVLRFGPDAIGAAHLVRGYVAEAEEADKVTFEFDPARRTADVDLVVGGQYKLLATSTEMRHRMALLGRPTLPPGTCRR